MNPTGSKWHPHCRADMMVASDGHVKMHWVLLSLILLRFRVWYHSMACKKLSNKLKCCRDHLAQLGERPLAKPAIHVWLQVESLLRMWQLIAQPQFFEFLISYKNWISLDFTQTWLSERGSVHIPTYMNHIKNESCNLMTSLKHQTLQHVMVTPNERSMSQAGQSRRDLIMRPPSERDKCEEEYRMEEK